MKVENFSENGQIEEYKTAVENLAKSKSSFIFPNKDAQHAAIVISNIINYSNCIKICDDDLSGDIADKSSELRHVIEKAVKSDKSVQFLIKDISQNDVNSEIYKLLERLSKEHTNLEVKKAKAGFFEKVKNASREIVEAKVAINFAIGDESSFRIEFPGENERSAFCSFNNTEITLKLLSLFETGFKDGTNVFSE